MFFFSMLKFNSHSRVNIVTLKKYKILARFGLNVSLMVIVYLSFGK